MPALGPQQIVDAILWAIQESGETGQLTSAARTHPCRFVVSGPLGVTELWVYAWTLTPGGRPQLENEYRIQMTSVTSPLALNPGGPTVLIGFEPGRKMFAGFDLQRHQRFTMGSPSVQIDITAIHIALQDGFAFDKKGNGEIAVGVRPDQFMAYARTAAELHRHGRDRNTFRLLKRVAAVSGPPVSPRAIAPLSGGAKRIVQTINRLARDANFRAQVMTAYSNRCAVTRMQLRVIEAAHVLPVGAPGSVDHVCNGIALSRTYHRAYDNGLIYVLVSNIQG